MELCAGSTLIFFRSIGNIAPKQILVNTINANADVTAMVSAMGVRKAMARMKPATDRTILRESAILNSRERNCFWVFSFSVPSAMPRMTKKIFEKNERTIEHTLEIKKHSRMEWYQ